MSQLLLDFVSRAEAGELSLIICQSVAALKQSRTFTFFTGTSIAPLDGVVLQGGHSRSSDRKHQQVAGEPQGPGVCCFGKAFSRFAVASAGLSFFTVLFQTEKAAVNLGTLTFCSAT